MYVVMYPVTYVHMHLCETEHSYWQLKNNGHKNPTMALMPYTIQVHNMFQIETFNRMENKIQNRKLFDANTSRSSRIQENEKELR